MWKQTFKPVLLHYKEVIVATISLLMFIVALLVSNQFIDIWKNHVIDTQESKIESGIQQELDYISKQREEIISSGVLNNAFKRNDLSQLAIISQGEAKKRSLDSVSLTDKDGFILTRTSLPNQFGDNIFQTTIHGREIAKGKTVTSAVNGARIPLALISGSFIYEQNNPIGSIITGRSMNNSYATRFQEKYLTRGMQVIFYTPKEGIVGDSLNDKAKTQLVNTYFSLGSDVGSQNLTGLSKEIKMGNEYYTTRNIVFPGLEESPGGALILFSIHHKTLSLFLASSIALFFLVLLSLLLFWKLLDHHKHSVLSFFFISLAAFTVMYFVALVKLDSSVIELKKSPYLIYNSTIRIAPESDVVNQSSEKTIAIEVVTGGEAINVVSAIINYDPKTIEVLDVITTNSFCDPAFFLEKEINKEKGEVRITCGIPNPGFSATTGTVAELLIQPWTLGQIFLTFNEETQILANDGLATNVLRMATGAYYQVVRQQLSIIDIKNQIPIFSSSHPNSNRWYKSKNIKLTWPELLNGTYFYSLSRNPIQSPKDKILSTTNNYFDIAADDGIYYFHLQRKDSKGKLGLISNFKIMIDATPPLPPKILASSETVKKGETVRLDFTSSDKLSGLQSGFFVKILDGIFLPVKPPFYIPFIQSGDYPITVRVFDRANNFSESSIVIHVTDQLSIAFLSDSITNLSSNFKAILDSLLHL